jgi:hypothetical protein
MRSLPGKKANNGAELLNYLISEVNKLQLNQENLPLQMTNHDGCWNRASTSNGLLYSTWIIGYYIYMYWMIVCGFYYQYWGSFLIALIGGRFRFTLHDDSKC